MNSKRIGRGVLYYGVDRCEDTVLDGEVIRYPRWFYGLSTEYFGLYRLRRKKPPHRFIVVNYTHPWFALGSSTSGGAGFLWSMDVSKRGGGRDGDTHRRYKGALLQVGAWWAKAYLYLFFKGDGLD